MATLRESGAHAPARPAGPVRPGEPTLGGRAVARVLVVHGDAPTRSLLSDVLGAIPADAELCDDGLAALRLLDRRRFDLVVCGDWLPSLRGAALAESCLAGSDPTPVVLLETEGPTGVIDAGGPRRAARVSCPFSPSALVDVCRLRLRSAALSR